VRLSNVQLNCAPEDYFGPCVGMWPHEEAPGGAVLSCHNSSVRFKSQATFSHNHKVNVWWNLYAGFEDAWAASGGGAWCLKGCRVVAEQRVCFLNNSADAGGGAIHACKGSTLVFAGGLELSGNSATLGGAVFLGGSRLQVTGGQVVCKGNVAGHQGSCLYATASDWQEIWNLYDIRNGRQALVIWNTSASCVQGNSITNGSMPGSNPGVLVDAIASRDPRTVGSNGSCSTTTTGACVGLGAITLAGSRLRFGGTGHNFGNNRADESLSCDIVAFPRYLERMVPYMPPPPGMPEGGGGTNFTASFACAGRAPRFAGAYQVEGDVCAASCKGANCTCGVSSKWSEAACSCV
jgi:predicted outer membrane repeat protein